MDSTSSLVLYKPSTAIILVMPCLVVLTHIYSTHEIRLSLFVRFASQPQCSRKQVFKMLREASLSLFCMFLVDCDSA